MRDGEWGADRVNGAAPDRAASPVTGLGGAVPTGAALAPLRARYASWLGLDTDQVLADLLARERDRSPSWHAALALAARGCAQLCLDPRAEPGGEWYDALHDYCTGHIRKVTRRARAGHSDAVAELPGLTLTDGDTQVRALLPGLVSELDKRVARLQVGGTDAPRDAEAAPRPADRPLLPPLRVWLNPSVTMTLGKAMAQTGHAGMIAAALLAETDPVALRRWTGRGLPTQARLLDPPTFERLRRVLADPATAWSEHGLLAVRDAGFTEIDPGTVTVIALAPVDR